MRGMGIGWPGAFPARPDVPARSRRWPRPAPPAATWNVVFSAAAARCRAPWPVLNGVHEPREPLHRYRSLQCCPPPAQPFVGNLAHVLARAVLDPRHEGAIELELCPRTRQRGTGARPAYWGRSRPPPPRARSGRCANRSPSSIPCRAVAAQLQVARRQRSRIFAANPLQRMREAILDRCPPQRMHAAVVCRRSRIRAASRMAGRPSHGPACHDSYCGRSEVPAAHAQPDPVNSAQHSVRWVAARSRQ